MTTLGAGLGLTDAELDTCWELAAQAEHPHREYTRQLERHLLRHGRREHLALLGLTLLERWAGMRGWAVRAVREMARAQDAMAAKGMDTDGLTDLIADYLASWGPETRD